MRYTKTFSERKSLTEREYVAREDRSEGARGGGTLVVVVDCDGRRRRLRRSSCLEAASASASRGAGACAWLERKPARASAAGISSTQFRSTLPVKVKKNG